MTRKSQILDYTVLLAETENELRNIVNKIVCGGKNYVMELNM